MKASLQKLLEDNGEILIKSGAILLILGLTYLAVRIFRRYIASTSERHHLAPQRADSISKVGLTLIYFISIAIISNVLGFGIQGIFLATSSFFAIVGIAFFANWSILSNVTASVLLYFTFPYRIGDRLVVDNEPKYTGTLRDVTIMYLKIQTDGGSFITIPANVAIQKVITIQSEADRLKALAEEEEKKAEGNKTT